MINNNVYRECRNTGCTRKAMRDGPFCSPSCRNNYQKNKRVTMNETQEVCPVCNSEPSDVSHQTASNQLVCTNDCPVITWDRTIVYDE